jgi:hypothetical protein
MSRIVIVIGELFSVRSPAQAMKQRYKCFRQTLEVHQETIIRDDLVRIWKRNANAFWAIGPVLSYTD